MAINFPGSPSANDTHTDSGITWTYDGEKWVASSGGGGASSATLQDVTDNGNTTTNDIEVDGLSSSGNVGIGTTSPAQKLHLRDSNGPLICFDDATTQFGFIGSYNTLVGSGANDLLLLSSANGKSLKLRAPTSNSISFEIQSTEAMRIDANRRLLVGKTASNTYAGVQSQIQLAGTSEGTSSASIIRYSNTNTSGVFDIGHSRGDISAAGVPSNGIVQNGDRLMRLRGVGDTNKSTSLFRAAAQIDVNVDAAPSAISGNADNFDMPGRLVFGTTAVGGTSPTERMRITSSGNVGIGTTNPTATLHIAGGTARPALYLYGSDKDIGYDSILQFGEWDGSTYTERMRINNNGRLLFGTTVEPDYNQYGQDTDVSIVGSGGIGVVRGGANASGPQYFFKKTRGTAPNGTNAVSSGDNLGTINWAATNGTDTRQAADIQCIADGTVDANNMPGRLVFRTTSGNTTHERMRVDSTGKLLVGTTSALAGGGHSLTYSDNSGAGALVVSNTDTATSSPACSLATATSSNSTSNILLKFFINGFGTGSGAIAANGASTAAFTSFSDERLKENIVDLPSQWDNIKNLRPVEFDYKAGGHQIGFIAQEFEDVYPDAVGSAPSEQDPEVERLILTGWSKTEARLVKALQEAIAKIETLETKVAALES